MIYDIWYYFPWPGFLNPSLTSSWRPSGLLKFCPSTNVNKVSLLSEGFHKIMIEEECVRNMIFFMSMSVVSRGTFTGPCLDSTDHSVWECQRGFFPQRELSWTPLDWCSRPRSSQTCQRTSENFPASYIYRPRKNMSDIKHLCSCHSFLLREGLVSSINGTHHSFHLEICAKTLKLAFPSSLDLCKDSCKNRQMW